MKNADMKITRWPYLVAGIIMLLLAGVIYAWSIFKAPLAVEFGWNDAELGLNFTVTMCGFCIGGVLGGIITKKLSPQVTVIIAAVMAFVGFVGSSRVTDLIILLYIFYGALAGTGMGIVYNVVISSVTKWFPDKRATVSGVLLMSVGASTLILGPIMNQLMEILGWRNAYFLLGIISAIVLVAGSFFLRPPDARVNSFVEKSKKKISEVGEDHTVKEMLKKSSFWKFYILQILIAAIGMGVVSMARDISISVGSPVTLAVLLVGILAVSNGLSRIFFGFLFDTIGRRKAMLTANVVAIIACVTMLIAVFISSVAVIIIGLVLIGIAYGAMPPICAGLASSFYGPKNFALNFSVMNTMLIPSSFAAPIAGAIFVASGSYIPVFIMMFFFALGALVLNLSLKKA